MLLNMKNNSRKNWSFILSQLNIYFFGRSLNLISYIYYALFLPIELNLRGQSTKHLTMCVLCKRTNLLYSLNRKARHNDFLDFILLCIIILSLLYSWILCFLYYIKYTFQLKLWMLNFLYYVYTHTYMP